MTMVINPRDQQHNEIHKAVRSLCGDYDSSYLHAVEAESSYPQAFVRALTKAGWLSALIPEEYGGGATLTEATVILEEINRSGANPAACPCFWWICAIICKVDTSQNIRCQK